MMKPSLTQIGFAATLLAVTAKANAADFATNVVTSVAADLLIGGGYLSAPIGIALDNGNGRLTRADRTSALYAGAKVTTDFSNPGLGDYFVEVGTFNGSSSGQFRDLSALFGDQSQDATNAFSRYSLKESFLQAYVGRRLATDQLDESTPRWQVLARVGFTYIDGSLRSSGTNSAVQSFTHAQDTQDWLGNVGLRADINMWPKTYRLFGWLGLPRPTQSRLILDGEMSGGFRNAKVFETMKNVEADPLSPDISDTTKGFKEQAVMTYGGIGRVTLLTGFEFRPSWELVLNLGLQSRYMWVHWDSVPDPSLPGTSSRTNVRGNELLWGPYFEVGIQHKW